jgi:hypothetical protein
LCPRALMETKTGRTSIAWLKESISQHYSMAKDTEIERGKDSILPPAPKKSFLDGAGGVDNGGCPAPTYFYDACTRVWRAPEKRSGTGQTKTAEYPSSQRQ